MAPPAQIELEHQMRLLALNALFESARAGHSEGLEALKTLLCPASSPSSSGADVTLSTAVADLAQRKAA